MKRKSNKIEFTQHIEESVEWILENKAGWTQFTNWAREKYHSNNRQANDLWKLCWDEISKDFSDSIKQSVNETLLKLERLEEEAIAENDRRIWLEVIKYRNKIRGGEIERHEVEHKGEVKITTNWGPRL